MLHLSSSGRKQNKNGAWKYYKLPWDLKSRPHFYFVWGKSSKYSNFVRLTWKWKLLNFVSIPKWTVYIWQLVRELLAVFPYFTNQNGVGPVNPSARMCGDEIYGNRKLKSCWNSLSTVICVHKMECSVFVGAWIFQRTNVSHGWWAEKESCLMVQISQKNYMLLEYRSS